MKKNQGFSLLHIWKVPKSLQSRRLKIKLWKSCFLQTSPNSIAEATMPSGLGIPAQEIILKSWPKLVAWGDIIGFFWGERDEMMKWVRSNMSNKNPARAPWPLYGCQALGPTRIAVLKENSLGQGAMIHTLAVLCAHKTGIAWYLIGLREIVENPWKSVEKTWEKLRNPK